VRPSIWHSAEFTRTYSPSPLSSAMPIGALSNATSKYRWASSTSAAWLSSRTAHSSRSPTSRTVTSTVNGAPLARRPSSFTPRRDGAGDARERFTRPQQPLHRPSDQMFGLVAEHVLEEVVDRHDGPGRVERDRRLGHLRENVGRAVSGLEPACQEHELPGTSASPAAT